VQCCGFETFTQVADAVPKDERLRMVMVLRVRQTDGLNTLIVDGLVCVRCFLYGTFTREQFIHCLCLCCSSGKR